MSEFSVLKESVVNFVRENKRSLFALTIGINALAIGGMCWASSTMEANRQHTVRGAKCLTPEESGRIMFNTAIKGRAALVDAYLNFDSPLRLVYKSERNRKAAESHRDYLNRLGYDVSSAGAEDGVVYTGQVVKCRVDVEFPFNNE